MQNAAWAALAIFVTALGLWSPLERDRGRIRTAIGLLVVWLLIWSGAGLATWWAADIHTADQIELALIQLAGVQIVVVIVFDLLLRRLRIPRFAGEIAVVAGDVWVIGGLLLHLGVNVTGIFTTSAVVTAIIGLSLQDMLSNIAGGIALEFEGGIKVGDYVKCNEVSGYVQYVRLRHTALRTTNGDTVILPNHFLTRSPVTVMSASHRWFVPFALSYSEDPHEVVAAVESALRSSPMRDIAVDPAPRCVIQELTPAHIQYAAIVWLSNPGHDTLPTHEVLNRVYFGLVRAGIAPGDISHVIETRRRSFVPAADPAETIRRVPVFRLLKDDEIRELCAQVKSISFAQGEMIVRQGDDGDSMYLVRAGRAAVNLRGSHGAEQRVAEIEAGDFFGEMSLFAGDRRSASVTALTRLHLYELRRDAILPLLQSRPELAEDMATVIAHRAAELSAVREKLDEEAMRLREASGRAQLLQKMRRYLGIEAARASA